MLSVKVVPRGNKGGYKHPLTLMAKHFPKGLDDRMRDQNGEIREKRSDTHVGTIEKEYGKDFGVRADMQLGTLLKREGVESLHELLKDS